MRILILEDDEYRQKTFRRNLLGHERVEIVDSSKKAIELLKNEQWDYVFLDHDLGGQVYVQSGEETGYEVAKFLSENKQFMPTCKVIIHSLNFDGRKNMLSVLPEAIEYPFVWEHISI